ncbi:hypothetical protein MPC1_2830004 [Methylocella tundrae]|nr:hypothetical protein MPC1_2830004 [Methylocella tundrae]
MHGCAAFGKSTTFIYRTDVRFMTAQTDAIRTSCEHIRKVSSPSLCQLILAGAHEANEHQSRLRNARYIRTR